MRCAKHKFHRDIKETEIFGYNGLYPGPTIEAMKGQKVKVKWINKLPLKHILPVDRTLDGAIDTPEVRTVVHLHGANVADHSDGHPEAWFSSNNQYTGPKYSREVYEYPNQQQATTLWYHDHAISITRLNLYSGLAGFYLIRDFHEQSLNLPKGKYDIPLMIQDKTFRMDGSLFYPEGVNPRLPGKPSVVRAFIGNTMVVNGKVWPYMNVDPRKYRFRMLNASNTNGFTFKLLDKDGNQHPFTQIGTDGGMRAESKSIEKFPLDPAERLDVIIDFSSLAGQTVTLKTEELTLAGDREIFKEDVMEFRVGELPLKKKDRSVVPDILRPFEKLEESMATKTRKILFTDSMDLYGRMALTLNNLRYHHPATEMPEFDSVEIWEFASTVFDPNEPLGIPPNITHPIHHHWK
jgi:spore coat protein A, manganese oxidase